MEIKKPTTVVQYNKFMKGIDRADQYLSYYSVLRKTVKQSERAVLYLPLIARETNNTMGA